MTETRVDSALGRNAPDPRRWQALALVCVAFFMTVLDGTIVTVALPSIKDSLHVADNLVKSPESGDDTSPTRWPRSELSTRRKRSPSPISRKGGWR